jgi:hypothetical protein
MQQGSAGYFELRNQPMGTNGLLGWDIPFILWL